jgi:SAM-dependent methyltransferase
LEFSTICPICDRERSFGAPDDYFSCRRDLKSSECGLGGCVVRERALASVLFEIVGRDQIRRMKVHEPAPAPRGMSRWLLDNVPGLIRTGYFHDRPFSETVGTLRNENLEHQTFSDSCFDVVIHLDVMEHLFQPFAALREIERTLVPGGICLFATPTYPDRLRTEQVAFVENGELRVVGEAEYHGNPQGDGSLVTWRYGYDLPLLISRETDFDVEVRRWQSKRIAAMGVMTEVYILRKAGS